MQTPADAFSLSSDRLQEEIREYLKDEDRWIPRGRDISLWDCAQMLNASARNLNDNLANPQLTAPELAALVTSATRRMNDIEYWAANVRTNEAVLRALNDTRTSLAAVQRSSRATPTDQLNPSNRTSFSSSSEPFSPNDLNSAVAIAKDYLQKKYGLKKDAFGNMSSRESSNHHEVALETRQDCFVLQVDTRQGVVLKEKRVPKGEYHHADPSGR